MKSMQSPVVRVAAFPEWADPEILRGPIQAETRHNPRAALNRVAIKEPFHSILLGLTNVPPEPGEGWSRYKERVAQRLAPLQRSSEKAAALLLEPLFASNALYGSGTAEQVEEIRNGISNLGATWIEWTPKIRAEQLDDLAALRAGLDCLETSLLALSGRGVTVAVLDSGIDLRHPYLNVAESVSTYPESCEVPGRHGTYCAGVIASKYRGYPGLAPEVRLLNIKVSRAGGMTSPAYIAKGIDEALDRGSDVLSISIGLNHLAAAQKGHNWTCPDGRCILCRAVDNAVGCCGVIVVASAGNEHLRAEALRAEHGASLDTELLCPGQARAAITVGAVQKSARAGLYPCSSHGPTSFGCPKPDLVAPGVDVTSTIPVPTRDGIHQESVFSLFGIGSGTSVSTAVVAGVVALLIEKRKKAGNAWTPEEIRSELLTRCVRKLDGYPPSAIGAGALDLSRLG